MEAGYHNEIGVDINSLKEAYAILSEQPQSVQNSLSNAVERLIQELEHSVAFIHSVSFLRQYIILFEYPLISDPTENRRRLGPLLYSVTSLPERYMSILKEQYFEQIPETQFMDFHTDLQNFIALHLIENEDNEDYNIYTDKYIIAVTQMIAILYDINKKRRIIPHDMFYSESINDTLHLSSDYRNWIDKGFSFCFFPCLLNPEVKSKLLHLESSVEKSYMRSDSFEMALYGYFDTPYLNLEIARNNLINTSLTALSLRQSNNDYKKELTIKFIGEEGVDAGGVQKEWFQLLVREIFDPKFGMFIVNSETRTHWFNMSSNDFHEFELIGKVLGLAVYNGVILDIHLPSVTYKKLMGGKADISDLASIDMLHARSLNELLKFDESKSGASLEDTFGLTFEVTVKDMFGDFQTYELKEGGAHIPVTAENRKEYVDLYVSFLLETSVKKQFESFKKGFECVCNSPAFRLFDYRELELLICGSPSFDFSELRETATYYDFEEEDITIQHFWKIMDEMDIELKKKFLFFTTGSDRSPIGGLGKLKINITKHGDDSELLPSAHTCFNTLLLPPYKSYEKTKSKLLAAIENSEGFGLM